MNVSNDFNTVVSVFLYFFPAFFVFIYKVAYLFLIILTELLNLICNIQFLSYLSSTLVIGSTGGDGYDL